MFLFVEPGSAEPVVSLGPPHMSPAEPDEERTPPRGTEQEAAVSDSSPVFCPKQGADVPTLKPPRNRRPKGKKVKKLSSSSYIPSDTVGSSSESSSGPKGTLDCITTLNLVAL